VAVVMFLIRGGTQRDTRSVFAGWVRCDARLHRYLDRGDGADYAKTLTTNHFARIAIWSVLFVKFIKLTS
jgi:hypothetical protein